jgi:hypothetical protein
MGLYVFPTSMQIAKIAQDKIPTLELNDPIFRYFPVVNKNAINLRWEQRDNYVGLQKLRGVGGQPQRVTNVGANTFTMEPGVYGEFMSVEEKELLEARPLGTWDGFVDVTDIVTEKSDRLIGRRVDLLRYIMWTLVTTGTFAVAHPDGGIAHTDSFPLQRMSAAVPWGTFATATPLLDFRTAKLLARGRSLKFDKTATAFMNESTFNRLAGNTNAADVGGKRVVGNFGTMTTVSEFNRLLVDADVPTIEIYEGGYFDESGTFQLFCPTGTVVIIGSRTNGDPLGEYWMTRNAVNPNNGPGPYHFVTDYTDGPLKKVPPEIRVDDGHNGGPVIYYPGAIIILNVS